MITSDWSSVPKKLAPTRPSAGSASAPMNEPTAIRTIATRWSSAQATSPLYFSAIRLNQALKRSSARATGLRLSCASTCGSGQYADNIGSSENETNNDTSTDDAMVRANGLNHWPATLYMNAIGRNTATTENVVAATQE